MKTAIVQVTVIIATLPQFNVGLPNFVRCFRFLKDA